MTPKQRLLLAGFVFLAWIGYLAYLVSITREPVILSRPQFLVADLYVLAHVERAQALSEDDDRPLPKVKIVEVFWAKDASLTKLADSTIFVNLLQECAESNGWTGAGDYILPLTKDGAIYSLTKIPASPGFQPGQLKDGTYNDLRIYPATNQAREQLKELIKDFHE